MNKLTKISLGLLALSLLQCKDDCAKSNRCILNPDVGPCKALVTKYYYDKIEKRCKSFSWGGCEGIVPFDSMEECENGCNCN